MIEKLKIEPYIKESLYAHLIERDGKLVAERYDTIYWVRESFANVACAKGLDCFVEAKKFCDLCFLAKEVTSNDTTVKLILFNGAEYELDKVVPEATIPTFTIGDLPNKSVFDFGGVEQAVSKSPLQKELNTVYADENGIVASSAIVGGISNKKFKSGVPFAVPEGVHSMFSGEDVEWKIDDGKLFVKFGVVELVGVLSKLSDFAWWDAVRGSFEGIDFENTSKVKGLRSSISRLSSFGARVKICGKRVEVDETHWEPIDLDGSGESFDIQDLMQVITDDEVNVGLFGGNLYLRTADADFVVCSVDEVQA